ncbi:hypothetical protein AMS68_002554 [Peltaster fructicola]|uniref:Uncharacterized protein n=1 Tax=Peltaster fructicola TaxID=286661 RepID=A0A6H0XQK2_9PEZI|nr:hypothetical protein AMS68_002554 [Peltaster fructicola]
MLLEQPLSISDTSGSLMHLGPHKDLICHSVIALPPETNSALCVEEGEAKELGLALKVTAPLRLYTRNGKGKRITHHIKTDVFLNGELVNATSRPCSLKKQPIVEEAIGLFSGVRVHRQVELPLVYRTHTIERDAMSAVTQQQRWSSVALLLLERAREFRGSATGIGPPSAEYLAGMARIPLPEQLKSKSANFAIIDVLVTAGQMGIEHSTSTYIKAPTLLKDPRYHTRGTVSTGSSPQKTGASGTARYSPQTLTTAYPSGHDHVELSQAKAQSSRSLLPQAAHFGTLSRITPSPYHSGPSSPEYYTARESLDSGATTSQSAAPGFLLHCNSRDAEVFEYPPPPYSTPISRRVTDSPFRGTENMSPRFNHVGSPFSPKPGFSTEITDGVNTYGTPVRQMIAIGTSGEVYELTPVKLQYTGHQTITKQGPHVPVIDLPSTNRRCGDRSGGKRCATSDPETDLAVTKHGTDRNGLDITRSDHRTPNTGKSGEWYRTSSTTSRKRSRTKRELATISVDSSPGKPGSNRSSTRWDPSEDTIEQALQKFEVPLLCRDSVVSFANTDTVRQIAKARSAEFVEEDFIVGFRFVVC